ncbi:hypothetical protein LOZ12_005590 [Ophidiomyces ophidiicola]|uniref:Uncharacterized protein n=1 Tax=Ophidiomyces ophidiicola TaxID=1387563 RepID=A0ACB8USF4_9EURO|nr:uncharacterized protein LOZ57_005022 [Ophidiomyces ophidiicola]KAI1917469.1 hypothetical protein LOZ61_000532 [Ophidiomyces ophidiicola]KAI1921575.1 hypothetical protein LOZ60_006125 [Ophidiomyces ophidiicola]KAI1943313.1 hypothetical protein LOZ57_005022 [Ophidiomyces ophidiicola]KAI1962696.1 hypothetical protein LOZ59_002032 [Ophidiomyces ophidiicola]KAI1964545.1 hypothetical protein LOZ56_006167 [Ophidiomyces ophidiicola]
MLSGSRHCMRTRAAAASVSEKFVLPNHEPLLFLYPRCLSSQVNGFSTIPAGFPLGNKRRSKLICKSSLRQSYCDKLVRHSSQLTASANHLPSDTQTVPPPNVFASSTEPELSAADSSTPFGRIDLDNNLTTPGSAIESVDRDPGGLTRHVQPHDYQDTHRGGGDGVPQNSRSPSHASSNSGRSQQKGAHQKGGLRTATGKNSSEPTDSPPRHHGWLGISKLLHQDISNIPFDPNDFHECLEIMNMMLVIAKDNAEIQDTKNTSQKIIELSEYDVVRLAGDDLENSWDISVVSGCRVHVLPRGPQDRGPMRKLLLSGSPKAIEMGEDQLRSNIHSPTEPALPPFTRYDKQGNNSLIRSVWTGRRMKAGNEGDIERTLRNSGLWSKRPGTLFHRRRPRVDRVDQLPVPETWTIRSLADYVESVTSFRQTKAPQRIIYDNGDIHAQVVKNILLRLCHNPSNRKFFSARTMNLVMSYLYHHKFFQELKDLFPLFEEFFTTQTFNTLLRSAAANYNLGLFKSYLRNMKEYRIQLNEYSWLAFLQAIGSHDIRANILDRIYREGVLKDPNIVRLAVSAAVRHKFRVHLENGGSGSTFIKAMNNDFGEDWISTSAVNKLVLETSLAKNLQARNDILHYCWQRELKLDTITLNNALLYYVEMKHTSYGIRFFAKFTKIYEAKPNLLTWQLLWYMGCRRRAYALCRAIWRHACLERSATAGIIKMVLRSLARPLEPGHSLTVGQRWHTHLGKIVTGILPSSNNTDSAGRLPFDPKLATVEDLCSTKDEPFLGWREKAAEQLIRKDLGAAATHMPSIPLSDMLLRASNRDTFWPKKHMFDVLQQRKNTIPFPVEPKSTTREEWAELEARHSKDIAAVYTRCEREDVVTLHDDLPDVKVEYEPHDKAP